MVGDSVVGTVVRGSHLGVHVKLANFTGLLGWVSHLLKPRFLRNSLEPTPVGVKGSSLLPIGLQREWKVIEIRRGQKPGQWYPRLSALDLDCDIIATRCRQILELSKKEPTNIRVIISGKNPGGLTLLWEGMSGFIPYSYLVKPQRIHLRPEELDQRYLGKELEVIMTEVKADRMSAVWDQRKAEDVRIERKCRPGTLHWGTVSHIKNSYGAYITLDDPHSKITGMLHISAISREHVESALDVFRPGDRVLSIITRIMLPGLSRIDLSTSILEATAGQILTDKEAAFANGPAVVPRPQYGQNDQQDDRRQYGQNDQRNDRLQYGQNDQHDDRRHSSGSRSGPSQGGLNGRSSSRNDNFWNNGSVRSQPQGDSFWDSM
ncbi:hypothetical protein WJX84_002604 [Apatococcus fuscideae]|uniref:S1 motif domain-containing protein n=1 Tax=Apatococcus fuscideae TaxID=2026836 RepID=A0AAW1TMU0_9CHLO